MIHANIRRKKTNDIKWRTERFRSQTGYAVFSCCCGHIHERYILWNATFEHKLTQENNRNSLNHFQIDQSKQKQV